MKTKALLLACLVAVFSAPAAQAQLFTGETFEMSINLSPADQTSFEDITPSIGPFTVDNTPVNVGPSLFNPLVDIEVTAFEDNVTPRQSVVTIFMVGVDANGDLANPVADGTTAANGNPFTIGWADLGAFNGGTDGLFPSSNPFADPTYSVDFAVGVIFGTNENGSH